MWNHPEGFTPRQWAFHPLWNVQQHFWCQDHYSTLISQHRMEEQSSLSDQHTISRGKHLHPWTWATWLGLNKRNLQAHTNALERTANLQIPCCLFWLQGVVFFKLTTVFNLPKTHFWNDDNNRGLCPGFDWWSFIFLLKKCAHTWT